MLDTSILDDSIKSPTLILADHSTLLFLPRFFYQIKSFLFLMWANPYIITAIYLHDPPPFNGPFFMPPPFSESQKAVPLLLLPPPPPPPLLISDKSLILSQRRELLSQVNLFKDCTRVWRVACRQIFNKISLVHALTSLANFSERIRERKPLHSSFFLSPTFARNLLPTSYPCFKELINNSQKYRMLMLFYSAIKTRQETLFDWLIIH